MPLSLELGPGIFDGISDRIQLPLERVPTTCSKMLQINAVVTGFAKRIWRNEAHAQFGDTDRRDQLCTVAGGMSGFGVAKSNGNSQQGDKQRGNC